MTGVTVALGGALTVGLAGIPALDPPLAGADTEKVFIELVALLLHPVLAGFCLAAILAAIMSTADSQLLVARLRRSPRISTGSGRAGRSSRAGACGWGGRR
jgi:sodium/proline symporter